MKLIYAATILILTLWSVEVQAQGLSLLGMCHKDWNCSSTKAMWKGKDELVFGWLENTFGASCKCAESLLNDPRPKTIRVHLLNSPCMRNRRCGRYEVLYNETKASASRKIIRGDRRIMSKFNAVLERAARRIESSKGNLQCYISPCLECDLNERARRHLADAVSNRLPNCVLVDSPYRQRCIRGSVCESHGDTPRVSKPCIVDLDGKDGSEINVAKWVRKYRGCDVSYYWEPWMNCIRGGFVDPRRRRCNYDGSIFSYTKGILCRYFYQSSDICSR